MKSTLSFFTRNIEVFLIAIIGLILILGLQQNLSVGPADFWKSNYGDIFVGLSTLMLAVATIILANNSERDAKLQRKIQITESRTDRRRLRIKEQIEGLYSPLMSHIEYFSTPNEHRLDRGGLYNLMVGDVRYKYEFLASEELKELLREYYHYRDIDPIMENDGSERAVQNTNIWTTRLNPIYEQILEDFTSLSNEYEILTFSTSKSP